MLRNVIAICLAFALLAGCAPRPDPEDARAVAPVAAVAEVEQAFSEYPGDLRMRTTFADGEAAVDFGPGEQRISRIWRGHLASRRPWEDYKGRIAIGDCVVAGRTEGAYAFQPNTDAGFRGLGVLNADSGTFAFWVRRSEILDEGGVLFSGKSFISGGPRGGTHWALGVGGRGTVAPAGRLFLYTDQHQCVADKPLSGGEWIHVAAVWDADMGAKLYANGSLVGSTWRHPAELGGAPEPLAEYRGVRRPRQMSRWLVSTDAEPEWHSLGKVAPDNVGYSFPGHPWEGVRILWDTWGEGFLRVIPREMPAGANALALRSPAVKQLPAGRYLATLRYRQLLDEEPDEPDGQGVGLRTLLRPAGAPEAPAKAFFADAPAESQWGEWHTLRLVFDVPEGETADAQFEVALPGGAEYMLGELRLASGDPAAFRDWQDYDFFTGFRASYWHDHLLDIAPTPVDRIQLHRHPRGGAVADIHVFDAPLTVLEIARLARGEIVEPGEVLGREAVHVDRDKRLRRLGWGDGRDGDLLPLAPRRALTVREQWAESVYEDLRSAGSIAADGIHATFTPWLYHGYRLHAPRRLHFKFPGTAEADYVVARGDMAGSLQAGGTRAAPFAGQEFLRLPGSPMVFRKRLDAPLRAASATVLRDSGSLSGLHFYRVEQGAPGPAAARTYFLGGESAADVPLCEWKRQEFATSYAPADRSFLVGSEKAVGWPEARPMPALRAHHFFSPKMGEDFPLAGVRLRLNLRGLAGPTRMQVRVHGTFAPWQELGRWDFLVEHAAGRGSGIYDLALMLRETLVLEGGAVWVAVILDRDAELVSWPGGGESQLQLYEADRATAERQFLEHTLAGWRNAFESTSEPRVWNRGISDEPDDGWWLRAASPEYEHMVRAGRTLLERYPDDPRVQSWFAFIHPRMPNPSKGIEPPDPGPHPRWAVLARANLQWYAQFVDFWTENRASEHGEFGHWLGDDTCLLQDWPDLTMIDDSVPRRREVVRRLGDGVHDWLRTRGRPFIVDGINSRWTDGLHAYEDGLNMQPMNFQLDYGNPVLFHRLLATAERYDGFLLTPEEDGMRRFNADGRGTIFWSTDRLPEGSPYDRNWFLATHAGQVLMWYNGHPKVSEMFAQVAEWLFHAREQGEPVGFERGGWYFLLSLWSHFGGERYLAELVDLGRARRDGVLPPPDDPAIVKRLPPDLFDAEKTVAASRADAEGRFDDIGTRWLGFGDRRYERNWFEWHLSRDKAHLEEALVALYQRLKFSMPAVTVSEQSGDRVSIPKQLISHMYLGGVPVARNNQFYPMYAVSYEGMGRNFAALVLEDTEDLLRVLFYSFDDAPRRAVMRVWNLGPGEHEISGGPDWTGDDRMDDVQHSRRKELVRGDGVAIEVPPQQLFVWQVRRVSAGTPLWERPDVALASEEAQWCPEGSLTVRVHNIGAVPSASVEVALQDAQGRTVARRIAPELAPPLAAEPMEAVFEMPLPADGWRFRTDPEGAGEERNWHSPGYDDSEWGTLSIGRAWTSYDAHKDYVGAAWYRRTVAFPARPGDLAPDQLDAVKLAFGGVDEEAWVWVNGQFVGSHTEGPQGWDMPFALRVGRALRWGEENRIVIRAQNTAAAGGVWRPVHLQGLRKVEPGPPGFEVPPSAVEVVFTPAEVAAAGRNGAATVVADPDKTQEEITRRNNRLVVPRP